MRAPPPEEQATAAQQQQQQLLKAVFVVVFVLALAEESQTVGSAMQPEHPCQAMRQETLTTAVPKQEVLGLLDAVAAAWEHGMEQQV